MRAFSFKRGERLLKRHDFERLSKVGNRFDNELFVVLYTPNGLVNSRLGVTVSKRVGPAVVRSRVKRMVREHFRKHKGMFSDSYDVNVIAKGAPDPSSKQIREALDAILRDILRGCNHEAVVDGTH